MGNLVAVPFKGGSILFAPAGSSGPEAFTGKDLVTTAVESLEEALDQVRQIGTAMATKLAGLDFATAEATLGIKVTAKGKFIVAESSAEASLTFKLVFKPQKDI
jgi:Trypsin-co-occurring domain 1